MLYAVIMAGGAGTRFWPESRLARPKQLLKLFGERTMLQATMSRLAGLVPPERTLVATTSRLARPIAEQLPELSADRLLIEPCKRDTAPCIGLAAMHLLRLDPAATMVLTPSDHLIAPEDYFREAIRFAAALVDEDPKRLVTFGVRPTYPAEGFGYIERGPELSISGDSEEPPASAYRVKKFHEKPAREVAQQYLSAGTYYWNSGIFVWKARTILDALAKHQPEIAAAVERIGQAVGTPRYDEVLSKEFDQIKPISIDHGVMERASDVVVIESPFTWDDVGSWRALERLRPADADGNVVTAGRHLCVGAHGTLVRSTDPNHLVVTVGVADLIVIVTPDATLIADKRSEESIRAVTKLIEEHGWRDCL